MRMSLLRISLIQVIIHNCVCLHVSLNTGCCLYSMSDLLCTSTVGFQPLKNVIVRLWVFGCLHLVNVDYKLAYNLHMYYK